MDERVLTLPLVPVSASTLRNSRLFAMEPSGGGTRSLGRALGTLDTGTRPKLSPGAPEECS